MSIILTPDWNLFTHIGPNINLIYADNRHLITTGSDGLFHCLSLDSECEQKLSCNLIHKAAITHLVLITTSSSLSSLSNENDNEKETKKEKIRIITAGSEGRVHCTDILDMNAGDGGYDKGNIKSILRTSTLIRAIEVIESMHVLIAMDSTDGRGSEVRMVAIHDIENTKNLYFDEERILEMKRGSVDKDSVWIIKSNGNVSGTGSEVGGSGRGMAATITATLLRIDKNLKIVKSIPINLVRGVQPIISVFEGLIALFNGQDIVVIKEEQEQEQQEQQQSLYHIECKMIKGFSSLNSLSWTKSHKGDTFLFGITKDKNLYIWQRSMLKESYKLNIPCEIVCSSVSNDATTISCIDEQGILSVIDICNNPRNRILVEKNQQENNIKQVNNEVNGKDEQKNSLLINSKGEKNEKNKEEKEEKENNSDNQRQMKNDSEEEMDKITASSKKKKKKRVILDDLEGEEDEERNKEKKNDNFNDGEKSAMEMENDKNEKHQKSKIRSSSPPLNPYRLSSSKFFINNIACWNSLGSITITNESVDIEYNEINKRAIRFEDDRLFTMGALSESGAVLANSNCIYFVPSNEIGILSKRQGWTLNSSISSIIIGIAIGRDYVWMAHDNGWIRMISVNGQQKIVFSPGCGERSICAISGNVKNNFLLVVTNNSECKIYDGARIVANSRTSINHILWIGFMDDSNIPACMDHDGSLYIWPFNRGYDWIVLGKVPSSSPSGQPQIPISITHDLVVIVPNDARSRVTIPDSFSWKLPFLQLDDYQNQLQETISKTHLLFEIGVLDNVLTEKEIKKLKNSTDKKILELIQIAIKQEKLEKSIELSKELFGEKSIELAVQLARHNRLVQLADQIESLNNRNNNSNNFKLDHYSEGNIKDSEQFSSYQQTQKRSISSASPIPEERGEEPSMTMELSPIKNEMSSKEKREISFVMTKDSRDNANNFSFSASNRMGEIMSSPLSTSLMMKKINESPIDNKKKKRVLKADLGWNNEDLDETQINHPSSDINNDNKENSMFNNSESSSSKMGFLSILSKYGKGINN